MCRNYCNALHGAAQTAKNKSFARRPDGEILLDNAKTQVSLAHVLPSPSIPAARPRPGPGRGGDGLARRSRCRHNNVTGTLMSSGGENPVGRAFRGCGEDGTGRARSRLVSHQLVTSCTQKVGRYRQYDAILRTIPPLLINPTAIPGLRGAGVGAEFSAGSGSSSGAARSLWTLPLASPSSGPVRFWLCRLTCSHVPRPAAEIATGHRSLPQLDRSCTPGRAASRGAVPSGVNPAPSRVLPRRPGQTHASPNEARRLRFHSPTLALDQGLERHAQAPPAKLSILYYAVLRRSLAWRRNIVDICLRLSLHYTSPLHSDLESIPRYGGHPCTPVLPSFGRGGTGWPLGAGR